MSKRRNGLSNRSVDFSKTGTRVNAANRQIERFEEGVKNAFLFGQVERDLNIADLETIKNSPLIGEDFKKNFLAICNNLLEKYPNKPLSPKMVKFIKKILLVIRIAERKNENTHFQVWSEGKPFVPRQKKPIADFLSNPSLLPKEPIRRYVAE